MAQAKNYAGKLAVRFAFSTNGQGVYSIDMQDGTEGELSRFPTPDELWDQTFAEANAWRDRFSEVPFEDRGGFFQGRYYQDIAIERALEARRILRHVDCRFVLNPSCQSRLRKVFRVALGCFGETR